MSPRFQVKADDVADRLIDGEIVVIHFGTNYYYSLNPAGTVLWNALREPASVADLADRLAGPGRRDEIVAGVAAFVESLEREGLIESVAAAPPSPGRRDGAGEDPAPAVVEMPVLTRYDTLDKLIVCGE